MWSNSSSRNSRILDRSQWREMRRFILYLSPLTFLLLHFLICWEFQRMIYWKSSDYFTWLNLSFFAFLKLMLCLMLLDSNCFSEELLNLNSLGKLYRRSTTDELVSVELINLTVWRFGGFIPNDTGIREGIALVERETLLTHERWRCSLTMGDVAHSRERETLLTHERGRRSHSREREALLTHNIPLTWKGGGLAHLVAVHFTCSDQEVQATMFKIIYSSRYQKIFNSLGIFFITPHLRNKNRR